MYSMQRAIRIITFICILGLFPFSLVAQDEDPVYLKRKVVNASGEDLPLSRTIPEITFTAFLNHEKDSVLIENAPRWDGAEGNWNPDFSRVGVELQNFYHFAAGDTATIRFNDRVADQQGMYSQVIDTIPWSDPSPFDEIQLENKDIPTRPQNVSIELNAQYERTLTWNAESGMEYWIYRKNREDKIFNGDKRNLYALQARGITSGTWTDPNTNSKKKFAYIIYAVNSRGHLSAHTRQLSKDKPASETSVYFKRFVKNADGERIDKTAPKITFTAFLNNEQDSVVLENAPRLTGSDVQNIDPVNGVVGVELQLFPQFGANDTAYVRVTDNVLNEQGTMHQVIDSIPWSDPSPFASLMLQSRNLPSRPDSLELAVSDNNERTLTWEAKSGLSYRVYRRERQDSLLNGAARKLYTLQASGVTSGKWTDPNTSPDKHFAYIVYAEKNGILSSHSSEVFRTKPLTGLTDSTATTRNISLTWTSYDPVIGETAGYNIYRRKEGGSYGNPEAYTGPEPRFTDSRLKTGETYYYKVVPRNLKRGEIGEGQEIKVTTRSSGNYTTYMNLKAAVVIYKHTNFRKGGEYQMSDAEVQDIKELMQYANEFYWRNTEMQLNFEFDFIVVDEFKKFSGSGNVKRTGNHLSDDYGVMNTQYDFVFRITPATGGFWSIGATNALGLPGPQRRTGFSTIQWPLGQGGFSGYPGEFPGVNVGYQLIWLFIHEGQHAIDGIYRHNGHPEMGHGDFPELYGNPDLEIGIDPGYPRGDYPSGYPPEDWGQRFGKRFDFQATLLRDFRDYKKLGSDWGEVIQAPDNDNDGLPDVDPRVPINEVSFETDPQKSDTDGDGYGDKEEAIDGIYHYSFANPLDTDTDNDGIKDGQDPNPRYPMQLAVRKTAGDFNPKIDGNINEWPGITMMNDTVSKSTKNTAFSPKVYMAYDADSLYVGLHLPKEAQPMVKWDFDADGRWYGSGNTNMVIDAENGDFQSLRTWDASEKVQQWLEDNQGKKSGDGLWDNSSTYRSAFGNPVFKRSDIRLQTGSNSEGGYDIEFAIPKNKQTGLSLESRQDLGVIVDYKSIGSSGAQATTFDQWSYEYVSLCNCTTTEVKEETKDQFVNSFKLHKNYPNPFNPSTTIRYALPKSTQVSIKVYNVMGRKVATLVDDKQKAGTHRVKFKASNLASGVYFYRISTPTYQKVRKMMLVK